MKCQDPTGREGQGRKQSLVNSKLSCQLASPLAILPALSITHLKFKRIPSAIPKHDVKTELASPEK